MGWIAGTEFGREARLRIFQAAGGGLLPRGTFLAEAEMGRDTRAPARLVHFMRHHGWLRQFSLYLNADRSISVEMRQGDRQVYGRLDRFRAPHTGRLRIAYVWNAPARRGALTVETPADGAIWRAAVSDPVPVPATDIADMTGGGRAETDPRLDFLAFSDEVTAVGPAPTILAGTPVATDDGDRPIEEVRLGDTAVTASGAPGAVRWRASATLPPMGSFQPVTIRAPYFGLERDITVARCQRLLVVHAEAHYMLGEEAVLVEAGQLVGHPAVAVRDVASPVTYHQILLDGHDCLKLAGTWAESLFVGRIGASPGLLAGSHLDGLPPTAVPVHARRCRPTASGMAAATLRTALSA